jgi:cytochrome c biogenesis protein CcdA
MMLGVITAQSAKHYEALGKLLMFYPFLGIIIPFFILGVYMAYQSLDDDDPIERVGDLIEYSIGLIAGLAI